ncbi:hypothetical protein GCM10010156_48670 [Planobispora rosea]|uniref:ATP-grasp domain-containing protein n=1 Tax=Planobispora rosea TaxID=35762 RepID=A0A8J3S3D0_PLARO|nr:hypothetical protein [Planobispora rosea]GGS84328.1 hypothetical protein GCM10010156_48670 [Planobispora rosea]GIH86378.1 hypothetical protein Pro02_47860 [Planobispora rosea]
MNFRFLDRLGPNQLGPVSASRRPEAVVAREAAPVLLLGGLRGPRARIEPLLAALAATGPVLAVDHLAERDGTPAEPLTWQRLYLSGGGQVPHLSAFQVLRVLRAQSRPVAGALTWDERLVGLTAEVAEQLHRPSYGRMAAAAAASDLGRIRALLAGRGCALVRAQVAEDLEQALAAAARLGYPVTIRPGHGGGAWRADEPVDVVLAVQAAAEAVVVEAGAAEQVLTAICASQHGQHQILALVRAELAYAPRALVCSQMVDAGDELRTAPALVHLAEQALTAVGVGDGITRLQVRLDAHGRPVLAGLAAGLGPGDERQLVRLATGLDLVAEAAAIARGQGAHLPEVQARCAAAGYVHALAPGRITRLAVADRLAGMTGVQHLGWDVTEGQEIGYAAGQLPPRLARMIVTGRAPDQCAQLLARLRAGLRVEMTAAQVPA